LKSNIISQRSRDATPSRWQSRIGHLTGVIALAGGDPSRSVMIGDSDIDLKTAKAAAVPAILVSFGYGASPVDGFAPEAVIDHFDELDGHAARLLNGGVGAPSRS
jgi:phosphoglycolate phosphatase-like HAD superfamily hydrolase